MVEKEPGSVDNDLPAVEPRRAMTFPLFKASRLLTPKIIARREPAMKRGAKP